MHVGPRDAYAAYSAAWHELASAARDQLLERSWADDGTFFDPEVPNGLVGREALDAYIAETHAEMPGLVITETSELQMLGNRVRVTWVAHQDGQQTYTGTDFIEFADDGRIARLTMFYDSTPD